MRSLLLWGIAAIAARVHATSTIQCGDGHSNLEYIVGVDTTEPIGMVLSDKLRVLSFVHDEDGRPRAVEATGLVEIGDELVAVNGQETDGTPLYTVVEWIRQADLPKKFTFRATNASRCIPVEISASIVALEDATSSFIVVTQGRQFWQRKFFAVLSEFGIPPPCYLIPLVLADPIDACAPLSLNVTDRYVLVQSSRKCSPHQQALIVGRGGGLGMLLAQHEGKRIESILSPRGWIGTINTPVVMVSLSAAQDIAEMIVGGSAKDPTTIQLVMTPKCEEEYKDPIIEPVTIKDKEATLNEAKSGNLVITSSSSRALTVEFIKAELTPGLGLGAFRVFVFAGDVCSRPAFGTVKGMFFLFSISQQCSLKDQITYCAEKGFVGILLVTSSPNSPSAIEVLQVGDVPIPCVFVSTSTFDHILERAEDGEVFIEFEPNNALVQQYEELGAVKNPENWPKSSRGRHILYHRMRKAFIESDHKLEALEECYAAAEIYYKPPDDVEISPI